jgi:acetoin:2,6-dichlorophenolindophenol oxidoreductase subunit beta
VDSFARLLGSRSSERFGQSVVIENRPGVGGSAEQLAEDGISAEVVDLRTAAPLNEKTILASVGRTGRLVVVDECPLRCGIASEIAASVAEHWFELLKAPIQRVTRAQIPVPYSAPLEAAVTPDAVKIATAVRRITRPR